MKKSLLATLNLKIVLYTILQLVFQSSFALPIETQIPSILPTSALAQDHQHFSIEHLSEKTKKIMIDQKVWNTTCPIPLERLRKVKFSYYDFNGIEHHTGEIVVLDLVSQQVVQIFKSLHAMQFPIQQARPIEAYNGNDVASMAANNSSCFNCREMTGTEFFSMHAYGVAIDINPIQNPYIGFDKSLNEKEAIHILPASGTGYLNRTNPRPGMVESVVSLFAKHGFKVWGGKWNTPIDWQHFQPSKPLTWLLAEMNYEDGQFFFDTYTKGSKLLDNISEEDKHLIFLYKKNRFKFIKTFKKYPDLFQLPPQTVYDILGQ